MLKEISIEIIRKCPNNCLHCSSLSNINCTEMIELEVFENVICKAKTLGLKTVCLSGGEPFLHRDIEKIIDIAISNEIKVIIYTSGISLNEQNQFTSLDNDLLKRLSNRVEKLIFNFEAATESVYDQVMGTSGCFNLFQKSIRSARDNGIVTEAHFVPMKINIEEIEKVIELGIELGIDRFSFLRLVSHGRAEANKHLLELTSEELNLLQKRLSDLKEQYSNKIRIGVPLSTDSEHRCEAAKGKLNIRYDGVVFPCEVFKNKNFDTIANDVDRNINNQNIDELYRKSIFLNSVRSGISNFESESNCEKCYGQYLIDQLEHARGN